ncbi:MAG TPA: glycosyltransferase family 2 protein [Bacteroidia bacterium]
MKLSVISIAYNNLAGLKKTLAVFQKGQFIDSIELVIVDGGSNDGTSEFLKEQSITQNWVSEPDKGIYNAMNKGLNMAKGDYVWFLNSGDFAYNAESVFNLLTILETNPDAVYSETMMVDEGGKELGTRSKISTRQLPEMLSWKSFRMGMNVSHQSFVIKRDLALPYDESYRYVSDIDWMIRCLKACKNIRKSERILACFTLDGFSSKHRKASNKERFKVLQKHYGFLSNLISHIQIIIRKILKPSGL